MPTSNGVITAPVSLVDVSKAIGVNSLDIGTLCGSEYINMWAKNKPIRKSSPVALTDDDRHTWMYGLRKNADGHFEYQRPRGEYYNEWFRLTDFNGYNHNAECPVRDFSTLFDKEINVRTYYFVINSNNFFNRGANVELPLSLFPSMNTLNSYIGLLFMKRGTNSGIYFTNGTRVEDACTKPEQQAGNIMLDKVDWQRGDIIDVYLCCATRSWVEGDTYIDTSIQRMDVSETNGHTYFTVTGFGLDILGYVGNSGNNVNDTYITYAMINFTNNSNGSVSFSRVAFRLQCDYAWGNTETAQVTFEAVVGGSSMYSRSTSIGKSNAEQWVDYDVAYCDGYVTVSSIELRDNNNKVDVFFYIRLGNARKLLVQGELNVSTLSWNVIRKNVSE